MKVQILPGAPTPSTQTGKAACLKNKCMWIRLPPRRPNLMRGSEMASSWVHIPETVGSIPTPAPIYRVRLLARISVFQTEEAGSNPARGARRHRLSDRISDSQSEEASSILAGATMPESANDQATCFVNRKFGFDSQLGLHCRYKSTEDYSIGIGEIRVRISVPAPREEHYERYFGHEPKFLCDPYRGLAESLVSSLSGPCGSRWR